ncbi:hypothetical protein FGB62_457g07 [Gracilaria domingensis]|nr:hypothetical protein FGB62_457g07 [Gracilaria domingensis]
MSRGARRGVHGDVGRYGDVAKGSAAMAWGGARREEKGTDSKERRHESGGENAQLVSGEGGGEGRWGKGGGGGGEGEGEGKRPSAVVGRKVALGRLSVNTAPFWKSEGFAGCRVCRATAACGAFGAGAHGVRAVAHFGNATG